MEAPKLNHVSGSYALVRLREEVEKLKQCEWICRPEYVLYFSYKTAI